MRVLACTIPGTAERLGRVLPDAELYLAYTTQEALRLLADKPVDLLLIGMRFDESRGLELPARRRRPRPRFSTCRCGRSARAT